MYKNNIKKSRTFNKIKIFFDENFCFENNKINEKKIFLDRSFNIEIKNKDKRKDFNTTNDNFEKELSSNDSSFEKKVIENKKIDSNFEIIQTKNDLKIYKYSNIERITNHNLIYQYYYDKFDHNDNKNAKIILFLGKTGDGKTTAINALFNIIKGIQREDKHRFVLIKEHEKEKGQAESQTDGLHIYYIKDYDNKPIIIIDSQGFGDTRGKEYDELIKETFEYAFANIIDHINAIFFIANSTTSRLDILIKYIFSCATSLFSEEITKNLTLLCTHADKYAFIEDPLFIEVINVDENFKHIKQKMDKKYWYPVDSLSIFSDEIDDKICKYSFEQLSNLYLEKIKNSQNKNILTSYEIIKKRNEIKTVIKNIILKSKNIISEKEQILQIEKDINKYQTSITDIEIRINNKNTELYNIYVPNIHDEISSIERQENNSIDNLNNQYTQKKVVQKKYCGGYHTYCTICEKNCHSPCDCFSLFFTRCGIFSFFEQTCGICGHCKSNHCVGSGFKYVEEYERVKVDNYYEIQEEKKYYQRRKDNAYDEYYRKKNEKEKCERELNNLNEEKNELNNLISDYISKKQNVYENISNLNKDITNEIVELIHISKKIKDSAMNEHHIEIENEYINSLIERINQIGIKNDTEIEKLKEFKKYNEIYQKLKDISQEELIKNGPENFLQELNLI